MTMMTTVVRDERVLQAYAVLAALSGFLVVALGAFAAHALKGVLLEYAQTVMATGVRYQMFHTLVLWLVAVPAVELNGRWQRWACRAFTCGILLFSGSLYALALTGWSWLGMVTPIGGLAFLAGWLCIVGAVLRRPARRVTYPTEV